VGDHGRKFSAGVAVRLPHGMKVSGRLGDRRPVAIGHPRPHSPATAELQQPIHPQLPVGNQHGVCVHLQRPGQLCSSRQPFTIDQVTLSRRRRTLAAICSASPPRLRGSTCHNMMLMRMAPFDAVMKGDIAPCASPKADLRLGTLAFAWVPCPRAVIAP